MTTATIEDLQADHKHWLREIGRWQGFLRTWIVQREGLVDDVRHLQERLDQYHVDLDSHAAALEAHRREILEGERAMVEKHRGGPEAEPALTELHNRAAEHHARQLNQHERLKSMHHGLMTQIATLGHGAEREE